jgi:glutaredoxin
MNYTIYIKDDCTQCKRVVNAIPHRTKEIQILDIDQLNNSNPTFIVPALFHKNQLLAYGKDIISYVNNKVLSTT